PPAPPLLWAVGSQPSSLAWPGIVRSAPAIEARLAGPRCPAALRPIARVAGVTLAAELATTPLLAFDFHRLSLVGLVANAALDWVMAPIMVLGGLTAVAGLLPPAGPVATLLGWGTWLIAWVLAAGVELFASLPLATLPVGEVDARLLAGWYALLIGLVLRREPGVRAWLAGVSARLRPFPVPLLLWSLVWG